MCCGSKGWPHAPRHRTLRRLRRRQQGACSPINDGACAPDGPLTGVVLSCLLKPQCEGRYASRLANFFDVAAGPSRGHPRRHVVRVRDPSPRKTRPRGVRPPHEFFIKKNTNLPRVQRTPKPRFHQQEDFLKISLIIRSDEESNLSLLVTKYTRGVLVGEFTLAFLLHGRL
jgi:hypothetical protein